MPHVNPNQAAALALELEAADRERNHLRAVFVGALGTEHFCAVANSADDASARLALAVAVMTDDRFANERDMVARTVRDALEERAKQEQRKDHEKKRRNPWGSRPRPHPVRDTSSAEAGAHVRPAPVTVCAVCDGELAGGTVLCPECDADAQYLENAEPEELEDDLTAEELEELEELKMQQENRNR